MKSYGAFEPRIVVGIPAHVAIGPRDRDKIAVHVIRVLCHAAQRIVQARKTALVVVLKPKREIGAGAGALCMLRYRCEQPRAVIGQRSSEAGSDPLRQQRYGVVRQKPADQLNVTGSPFARYARTFEALPPLAFVRSS
jgi:hypothetical protein